MKANAIAVEFNGKNGMVSEQFEAKKQVAKTVPAAYSRIFKEKTEQEYKNRIIKACYGEADVKVGDCVYYVYKVNLGTKKHPYIIDKVDYDQVTSIGDKVCIMMCGGRPYHENIIAVYTGVKE